MELAMLSCFVQTATAYTKLTRQIIDHKYKFQSINR